MANKTKLPQTNTNQNVFTLDDGTKEITLVNPYGKVICKLHIRPGDVSIYDRYKALMDDFDSIIKLLSDMDIKDPPHNCAQTIHIIPATQISRKSAIQAHYLHTK